MGMYDYLDGEQVKCFYIYGYSTDIITPGLWISGGSLESYPVGSKVPYKTKYYDYTKNFNIIITDQFSELPLSTMIGVIRNGILKKVIPLSLTIDDDWKDVLRCIDYYGDWLNIHSKKEAEDFVTANAKYWTEKFDYIKNKMPVRKKINHLMFGIGVLDPETKKKRLKEFKDLKEESEKENEKFDIFNENLYKQTLAKYMDHVKPDSVIQNELLGAYESALERLENLYQENPSNDILQRKEACYKEYMKLKEKKETL